MQLDPLASWSAPYGNFTVRFQVEFTIATQDEARTIAPSDQPRPTLQRSSRHRVEFGTHDPKVAKCLWLARTIGRPKCDEYGVSKMSAMAVTGGAMHVSGSLGKSADPKWVWALLLTNLAKEGEAVDLSGSVGVSFRARSAEGNRVAFSVEGTVGGVKLAGTGNSHRCEFRPQGEWAEYSFRWEEFTQPVWACPGKECVGPLTVEKVQTFNWSFLDEERAFDLWLDEVRVIYEEE